MHDRAITIREVARDAQVSTATVSRALNEPWRVSPATRERVSASVEKLGFKPNLRARLLARGSSETICFLLCNRPFVHSYHAQILQGAALEAEEVGVQMVYASARYSPSEVPSEIEMPRILAARGLIDGVIVAGTNYINMLKAIEQLGLPYVVFGTNLVSGDGAAAPNAVYVDDEDGGGQAAEHLISLGHERIGFVGDLTLPWYKRRYSGYVKALSKAGLMPAPALGSASEGELAMGYNAVNELCDRKEDFTALFVGGDMGAIGALKALRNRGLDVPRDVSVVGFNDEEVAEIAEPLLTTIRVPKEEVGARCVRMLDEAISNRGAPREPITLPVRLVTRESTAQRTKRSHLFGQICPNKHLLGCAQRATQNGDYWMSLDVFDLTGKAAVITGGGGVLCKSMAKALAGRGVAVAVLDLRKDAADAAAREVTEAGGRAIGVECDVLERGSLEKARDLVLAEFGTVDILVNGAGGNSPKATTSKETLKPEDLTGDLKDAITFFDLDPAGAQFVFNLNFLGTLLPTQVFGRVMAERGRGVILNVSSMNAFRPLTKIPCYSAAKAAISNFTMWLATHFAPVNVRVNAIAPGFFLTDQNRFLLTDQETGELTDRGRKIIAHTPMERFGNPQELHGAMIWLVSEASSFVTGVVVPIDGGFAAYSGV